MQHSCRVVFAFVFVLAFLGTALGAQEEDQEIVLESMSDVPLLSCDMVHVDPCVRKHVGDGAEDPRVGSFLWLDGRAYILQWMGPGYYLESGVILEVVGEALPGLQGQRWREVYPNDGVIHTSLSWEDVDRNQALSVSDTLVLEPGRIVKVKDVRLRLRVKPAGP